MSLFRITTTTEKAGAVQSLDIAGWSNLYDTRREFEKAAIYSRILVEKLQDDGSWFEYSDDYISPDQNKRQRALNTRIKEETKVVRKIVERAIRLGHMVSVYDGEEYPVKRSTNKALIMVNVYATDMDKLYFRNAKTGESVGCVLLVYGNSASEVMADWSDNEATNDILADAKEYCDKLAAKGQ